MKTFAHPMACLLLLILAAGGVAQPTAPTPPATSPATGDAAALSTDELLDRMHQVGIDMKSMRADLSITTDDIQSGEKNVQSGTIVLQRRNESDTRIFVKFTTLVVDDARKYNERIEYLLDGDWVVDRNYGRSPQDPAGRRETHRQIKRPDEKVDLLKLGEGPFPLPIGQAREAVRQEFEVNDLPPDDTKPAGLIGLELRPRPENRLSDRFESITVWVDPATGLPNVIETIDVNATQKRETRLDNVKLNEDVTDADFKLDPIDDKWTVTRVPLK